MSLQSHKAYQKPYKFKKNYLNCNYLEENLGNSNYYSRMSTFKNSEELKFEKNSTFQIPSKTTRNIEISSTKFMLNNDLWRIDQPIIKSRNLFSVDSECYLNNFKRNTYLRNSYKVNSPKLANASERHSYKNEPMILKKLQIVKKVKPTKILRPITKLPLKEIEFSSADEEKYEENDDKKSEKNEKDYQLNISKFSSNDEINVTETAVESKPNELFAPESAVSSSTKEINPDDIKLVYKNLEPILIQKPDINRKGNIDLSKLRKCLDALDEVEEKKITSNEILSSEKGFSCLVI